MNIFGRSFSDWNALDIDSLNNDKLIMMSKISAFNIVVLW